MATLASFFAFSGEQGSDANGFYNVISVATSSLQCHTLLIELFFNALKLSSIRYRTGAFPTSPQIASIPNSNSLDALLAYLPAELQKRDVQVLFEHWALSAGPGNNACYLGTSDAANALALTTAYQQVRGVQYAVWYNELRETYASVLWTNMAALPTAFANPTPSNAPAVATVKQKIDALAAWSESNDPQLVALAAQSQQTTAGAILGNVLGAAPGAIAPGLFCTALTEQIQINRGTAVISTGKRAGTVLFETLKNQLGDSTKIWQTNAELKTIADSILGAGTPKDINKTAKKVAKVFAWTRQLFQTAFSVASTEAPAAIQSILNDFSNGCTANPAFLLSQLQGTCATLLKSVNMDPTTLAAWSADLDQTPPQWLPQEVVRQVAKLACERLTSIELSPKAASIAGGKIQSVRLFPFTNYNTRPRGGYFQLNAASLETTDGIDVVYDARENDLPYSRPIYAVGVDNNDQTFLKFFNVGGATPAANFHFFDAVEPERVLTHISGTTTGLTIDFGNTTIDGSERVPTNAFNSDEVKSIIGLGSRYKQSTPGGGTSRVVFIGVLCAITKWKDLVGYIPYDVLYELAGSGALPQTPTAHLIWRLPSGRGLERADRVDDSLCLWQWHGEDSQHKRLPEILGLPMSRRITSHATHGLVFGDQVCAQRDETISGISYRFLDVSNAVSGDTDTYVLTNTPSPRLPECIDKALSRTKSTKLGASQNTMLGYFDFSYFRRIDRTKSANPKVMKWVPLTGAQSRPKIGDGTLVNKVTKSSKKDSYAIVGIDLPVSFRCETNIAAVKSQPGGRPTLKNKGSGLHRKAGKRLGAGAVMNGMTRKLKNPPATASTFPATIFANWAMGASAAVRNEWTTLKDNPSGRLPVDEEWCHLRGHGDGGGEHPGNFVSGSYHCNTEQLAIETGQRATTLRPQTPEYTLRATAYLLKDGGSLLTGNYLESDKAFKAGVKVYQELQWNPPRAPSDRSAEGNNAPLAAFIRYKIYKNDPSGVPIKMFDHIFEGQSECIDVHQFEILSKAVEFALAGKEKFESWYAQEVQAIESGKAAAKGRKRSR